MASLNDIPLVGNVVNRIEDAAVDSAILRFRYLLCYKTFIKVLKTQVDKLKIEEDAISRKADAERDDGKLIKEHVLKWQQDVENIKMVVQNLFERYEERPSWMCFKDLPFAKPVSRFRLGKQAAEDAITVTQLTETGKDFLAHEIAHRPPKENVPISHTPYQSFKSREEAYGKLWEALINPDGHPILGIYGMAGVGKTRLMEEAWKQAKEKSIFHKVTRANVGAEKIDVIQLQGQLAGYLDCRLESNDNVEDRASQLKNSLINGGKTLVILDDVWDNKISLNQIGIPFGDHISKGCKILFTSRKKNVCLSYDCKDPIKLKTLTDDEAWHMFENTVGTSKIKSLQEPSLAEKVCIKCRRLPLLINAVANALKFMTENSWKDALSELENCRYEEIDGMEPGVYSCLRLSFDKLTESGKTCLLLCSFFPEDADIDIKELSNLATGSQLLNHRKDIGGVVDILKSSSVLIQGKDDGTVKLHDVIRDVARSIAARDPKYAILSIRCSLGLPDYTDYDNLKFLQLDLRGKNVCFPNDMVCPELCGLWLEADYETRELSSGFSEGLSDLRFLLRCMKFSEKQLSFHRLETLKMIIIDGLNIDETFFISVPQTLQTLSIKQCGLPSPLDLSKLKSLRKLELINWSEIKMVPNSISSLSRLEELNIPCRFTIREDADSNVDADVMSIYLELNKLTRLRKLTISLPSSRSCLDGDIMSNLQEFNISVGSKFVRPALSNKTIMVVENCIESGWMALIKRAEDVCLYRVEGCLNDSDTYANLKRSTIEECDDIDDLLILPSAGRNQLMVYFSNLRFLTIDKCGGLKHLFSVTVAKCLLNIKKLIVKKCNALEEIVRADYGQTDDGEVIISFPELQVLHLTYLPSLKSFSTHNKVAFPSLEELYINHLYNANELWGKGIDNQEYYSFSQLKFLKVFNCDKLESVIPATWNHEFNNLEQIDIRYCNSLKRVFHLVGTEIGNLNQTDGIRLLFSSLKKLRLMRLLNIKMSWSYDHEHPNLTKISIPNLEVLEVSGYEISGSREEIEVGRDDDSPSRLKYLMLNNAWEVEFLGSQCALQLQNLRILYFYKCIWHEDSLFNKNTPTLNTLTVLELYNCETGPTLFTTSCFRSFHQLRELSIRDCESLEEIVVEEDSGMEEDKTISVPSLRSIALCDLRSLISFSQSSSYAFNMPALEEVHLYNCPRMDKFTSLPINTPLLKKI